MVTEAIAGRLRNLTMNSIAPQKQMTGMLGHPVAENPIDRMFDAVYAHHGLHWQFWKNDIANERDLALAVAALRPLGYRGMCITVPWKVAVMPLLDEVSPFESKLATWLQGRMVWMPPPAPPPTTAVSTSERCHQTLMVPGDHSPGGGGSRLGAVQFCIPNLAGGELAVGGGYPTGPSALVTNASSKRTPGVMAKNDLERS